MAGAYPWLTRRQGTKRRGIVAAVAGLDVSKLFAATPYAGTGSAQTVVTGFQPDLTWLKNRQGVINHYLIDSQRSSGAAYLSSNSASAESVNASLFAGFAANGFKLGAIDTIDANGTGYTFASWSFKQDPRFFKVVTYTGNGTTQVIPHGLSSSVSVGMVVIKRRDAASATGWYVWHRGAPGLAGNLNLTNAFGTAGATGFGNNSVYVAPNASGVTVGSYQDVNASGGAYVMYVFAHDTASDGVIQCGSMTGADTINLGWRPQYLLAKGSNNATDWYIQDTARGWGAGADAYLMADLTNAEATFEFGAPTSTGFTYTNGSGAISYIYLAIRAVGG